MPANPFSGLFGAPAPSAARNPFSGLFGGAGPLDEEETLSERLERERLEAEEKTKAEQRRLREEREREMREMGATDAVAPARRANPLDALRRAGVAMTAAVPAVSNIKESAARLLLPAGPIEDAAVRGLTGTERSLARRGEELTGLPLTNEGVARRTDEWRSLEHPGQSPLEEALGDTVLEGVGGMLDVPGPGGAAGLLARRLGRGATAVPAGMLASAERRALPALRAEVDAIMPKLAGKTREELAGLAASAKPGTALSIAARRAMGRADLEDAGVGVGEEFAARPGPRAAAAAPVTPEEAAAKAARFRAALAKKATTGPPPGMVAEEAAPFDVAAGHPTRPTAQKLEPPDVPFEFNARRLNLSEADAGQLLSTIRENMPAIQAQRRAGQGGWDKFSAPDRLAARLGITKERLLKTKAGTTFNDEEFAVLDSTLGGVSERISSISKEIATGAATEAARAELAKLTVEYATLLKVSVGAGSEAGRALGSLRAFKKAMALPDRARMAVLKKYGSLMDDAKVERLATIDNPDDMAAFLRTLDQPKAGELVHEAYISSLVSGLASQERNLLGNSVMALTEQGARTLRRTAAAAGDVIRSRVTGAPRQHFASEATAGWVGMGHGFRRGLSKAAVVFRKGYDPATPLDELVGKFQFGGAFARHPSKAVRALGLVITPPLRALSAVDAFYKTIGFTSEQYALATKAALRSGKRGEELAGAVAEHLNDPDILEAAGKYAAGVTLTDAPSEVTARFLRFRDAPAQSAPAKVARGGIKFIAPFVKIADRLMVKGFEYTPVGAIRGVSQMAKGATTEGADLLARSAIGSTVMLGVAGMAEEGNLTAWAPRDDIEKERFYAAQKQPWSMKIGNRWVPYAQLEPFSTPIAIVAAARQAYEESGELPPADVALHVMQALAQRTLDASYMDSVQSLFESMSSDERAADKLARISSGIATGVAVPYSGAVRSVAQAQDPRYVRPEGFWENVMAGLPWLREKLPPQIDRWGEEEQMVGGSARAYLAAGTPLLSTEEKVDPVDDELQRLGVEVGHVGRSVDGLRLDDEHYRQLQTSAGRAQREAAERVMALDGYAERSPDAQQRLLESAIESSRDRAKAQFRRENRDLFSGYRRARRSSAQLGSLARDMKKAASAGRAGVADARKAGSVADILAAKKSASATQQQAWGAAAGELAEAAAAMRREGYSEEETRKWLIDALRENGIAAKDARVVVGQIGAAG